MKRPLFEIPIGHNEKLYDTTDRFIDQHRERLALVFATTPWISPAELTEVMRAFRAYDLARSSRRFYPDADQIGAE